MGKWRKCVCGILSLPVIGRYDVKGQQAAWAAAFTIPTGEAFLALHLRSRLKSPLMRSNPRRRWEATRRQ